MATDDDVRASCFAALDVLSAKHGPDVPYAGGLDAGFAFRGGPMLELLKGAHDKTIALPRSTRQQPDRNLLAVRFERFLAA